MPGYEQYARMAPLIRSALSASPPAFGGRGGGGGGTWAADGKSFDFDNAGKRLRFDIDTKRVTDATTSMVQQAGGRGGRGGGGPPARGRQFEFAVAPAGNHRAIYKDRNIWVGDSTGAGAVQITTEGSEQARIKYGTASWVYGEELGQVTAMWWSPDGKKLAYYRFDESKVPDYYITPEPDANPRHARRRGVSETGRLEPSRRSLRLRRRPPRRGRGSTCVTAFHSTMTWLATTCTAFAGPPTDDELTLTARQSPPEHARARGV